MTLEKLIKEFEQKFPDWDWLIRSGNSEGHYFCNLTSPDFQGRYTIRDGRRVDTSTGKSFKALATTKEQAFQIAYELLTKEEGLLG